MKSHATHAARARNKRGSSVEVAWILRGFCVGFAWVSRGTKSFFCLNVNAKDINVSLAVLYRPYFKISCNLKHKYFYFRPNFWSHTNQHIILVHPHPAPNDFLSNFFI